MMDKFTEKGRKVIIMAREEAEGLKREIFTRQEETERRTENSTGREESF